MERPPVEQPLAGVRVLSLGQYYAGPLVAMHLAEQGARVTQIDPPSGPRLATAATAAMRARVARVLALDLATARGRAEARALALASDVLVENFGPGVMSRLGLEPCALRRARPALVCVSLPGFARRDSGGRARGGGGRGGGLGGGAKAWEGVVLASCGVFRDMGPNRQLRGVAASYTPLPLASAYASVLAATAVVLALRARLAARGGDAPSADAPGAARSAAATRARAADGAGETFGDAPLGSGPEHQGDEIEVPLAAALMDALAHNSLDAPLLPRRYERPREAALRALGAARAPPLALTYDEVQLLLDPFYAT